MTARRVRMPSIVLTRLALLSLALPPLAAAAAVEVEPAELTTRPELVGKEIVVEDRIQRFVRHKGGGIESIVLMRSPVVFRVPPRIGFTLTGTGSAARLRGILHREGNAWVCDVLDLEFFPRDMERLEQALAAIPPADFAQRYTWADWAKRRGRAYKDAVLTERGKSLEAEAIRIESDQAGAESPERWLVLAKRARAEGIVEPEPSALAHRAYRAQLERARTADALAALGAEIAAFFPNAVRPLSADDSDHAAWDNAYASRPAAAYRSAPPEARAYFDRQLWADARQRLMEHEAAGDRQRAIELADRARSELPDRPKVADRLLDLGLAAATKNLRMLRLAEVEEIAAAYRIRLGQPERAQELLRAWLDDQRKFSLSPTDAEGRVTLAEQYERLLSDKTAAIALLRSAWAIDPRSEVVANAFLTRGFQKRDDQWVELASNVSADGPAPSPDPSTASMKVAPWEGSLRGKLPKDVRELLGGGPTRVCYVAARGEVVEQWIYVGARHVQYVNFVRRPGEPFPHVSAYYSVPRSLSTPGLP